VPDIVQTLLAEYGLLIILAAIALEGLGIPAPGQSLLVAGALLSAHGEFDIRLFLALTWIAALAGSMLGYTVGRFGGRKLLLRLPLNPSRIERMEAFCQRFYFKHIAPSGPSSVFTLGGRCVDGLVFKIFKPVMLICFSAYN